MIDLHHIRTRGVPDHAHLDFHLTVSPETTTSESHAISHRVIDLIQHRFPGIRDITPHVEPPGCPSGPSHSPREGTA